MTRRGFTIVELVVAIAVIAILAAVVVVSYNGWRTRMAETEVKHNLTTAASKLKDHRTWNNAYPATLAEVFSPSGKVTVTYVLSGANYCLRGASTDVSSVRLYINSATSQEITTTAC